jgi:hypothetical protein
VVVDVRSLFSAGKIFGSHATGQLWNYLSSIAGRNNSGAIFIFYHSSQK